MAEEVHFHTVSYTGKYMSLKGKETLSIEAFQTSNLQNLTLPSTTVTPTFYSILSSKCPQLKSLIVEGCLLRGKLPTCISHSKMETLSVCEIHPSHLTIHCPFLTSLSIEGGESIVLISQIVRHSKAFSCCHKYVGGVCFGTWQYNYPTYNILTHVFWTRAISMHSLVSEPYKALVLAITLEVQYYVRVDLPHGLSLNLEFSGYNFEENVLLAHSKLRSLKIRNASRSFNLRGLILECPKLSSLEVHVHLFFAPSRHSYHHCQAWKP